MKLKILTLFIVLVTYQAYAQKQVSMIQLIANPKNFEGKKIRVIGYYDISVDNALFVNKDSASNMDISSSISVQDESDNGEMTKECYGRYVQIEGTTELNSDNYYQIIDVTYILDIEKNNFCWEKK